MRKYWKKNLNFRNLSWLCRELTYRPLSEEKLKIKGWRFEDSRLNLIKTFSWNSQKKKKTKKTLDFLPLGKGQEQLFNQFTHHPLAILFWGQKVWRYQSFSMHSNHSKLIFWGEFWAFVFPNFNCNKTQKNVLDCIKKNLAQVKV